MIYSRDDSPLYKLIQSGTKRTFPKGQVVDGFNNQTLHLITEGYVKRYLITKEGNKSVQVIYGPNDIFPLTPVYKMVFSMDIYSGPEDYYYEAITPLIIHTITIDELLESVEKDPELHKDLFLAAGMRLNSYIHRLESISLGVANKKIYHQLLYLADIFGRSVENGILIELPLTHQTIAEILDMARETVSLHMVRLQEKGIINVKNKQVTLLSKKS